MGFGGKMKILIWFHLAIIMKKIVLDRGKTIKDYVIHIFRWNIFCIVNNI